MSRQKKIKNIQSEEKPEVHMVHDKSAPDAVAVLDEVTEAHVSTDNLELLESDLDRVRKELEEAKSQLEEKKQQLKFTPMREIDEDEMILVKKQSERCVANKAFDIAQAKQKTYDQTMITGRFINRHNPGKKSEKLTYLHYADDPVKWWEFADGQVYTICRGFADEIKNYYHKPHAIQKHQSMDPNAPSSSIAEIDTSDKKYDFVPLSF